MNKMNVLIYFFLLLQFSSLSSFVSADGIIDTCGGIYGDSLKLIKCLEELLKDVPNLGEINCKELAENLKKLYNMGIKMSKEELLQKANETVIINKHANEYWKAELPFTCLLPDKFQRNLNGLLPEYQYVKKDEKDLVKRETKVKIIKCTYKTEFDARDKWPKCKSIINNVVNQGQCGSCWAIAAVSAFTDCFCIERSKRGINTPNNEFYTRSAFDVLTCAMKNGCSGGRHDIAFNWMKTNGVCTGTDYSKNKGCKPYSLPPTGPEQTAPACSSSCTNKRWGILYNDDKQKGVVKTGRLRREQAIINQLKLGGPLVIGFMAFSDIMAYKTGVYFKTAGSKFLSGHVVVVVGYGTQTCGSVKTKYWIIRNSWGTGWGDKGFGKFIRGVNDCRIEDDAAYGTP